MNHIETVSRGTIHLGENVMVSDPCYGLNTWCQGIVKNVLPGNYECFVEYRDEGDWGTRVSAIQVTHVDYDAITLNEEKEPFEVGVDSGQAGIFDYDYYEEYHSDRSERPHVDENWYDEVCELTSEYRKNPDYEEFSFDNPTKDEANGEEFKSYVVRKWEAYNDWLESKRSIKEIYYPAGNTIDGFGFVSSSGYGDGGYDCWTAKNEDGKVVSIRVEFIGEYDEDEDCED